MNPHFLIAALILAPLAAMGGGSAHYTLEPVALDSGGGTGTSTHYQVDRSLSAGGAGSSLNYTVSTGFAGQLIDPVAIVLSAVPATVDEGGTRQLAATLHYADATTSPLDAGSLVWSVQSGPITIDTAGLATGQVVYQDTGAVAQGTYQAFSDTQNLTVLDIDQDNYGPYAADGIEDAWQNQYFSADPAKAGPLLDPDGDGQNNLFEFVAGVIPNDALSRFHWLVDEDPLNPGQSRIVFSPRFGDRTYNLKTSTTLQVPDWITFTGGSVSDDGTERTVIDPDTSDARKFYRLEIAKP
jgi:hypothetical protein